MFVPTHSADDSVLSRSLIAAIGTITVIACGEQAPDYGPVVDGARQFRPLGDVFFLPDHVPLVTNEGAAKIPDSKIEWNIRAKLAEVEIEGVRVKVREQHVVLEGRVPDEAARAAVEELTLGVAGVAGVRNKLEIE